MSQTKAQLIDNLVQPITGALGSAAAPTFSFTADPNTGLFSPGADAIALATAGTNRLHITSAGLVGIGTTTPGSFGFFAVRGFAALGGSIGDVSAHFSDGVNNSLYIKHAAGEVGFLVNSAVAQVFYINSTERARIDNSGRLLVGTSTARSNFYAGTTTPGVQLPQDVSILRPFNDQFSCNLILAKSRGTGNVVVNSGDNVGTITFQGNDGTNFISAGEIRLDVDGTPGANDMPGRLVFSTTADGASSPTERMRIDSNGNMGIGTTSPISSNNNRLSVETGNTEAIVIKSSGGQTYTPAFIWNTATSGNNFFLYFATEGGSYPGTFRGSVDFNRGAGSTRYNTTSDATLKNILGDSDGAKSVEILNSTRIREFAWKDDEAQKPQIGVIAQELYETYKGAVSVGGDVEKTNDEGNVTTEYRAWGVDKTAFTFHLIAGWQAHEKMIQELKAELDTVKAELASLKEN